MFCISINYKSVPAKLREKHAFTEEQSLRMQETLKREGIAESVYLNTCNRCELYGVGDYKKALKIFAGYSDMDPSQMRSYALIYDGMEAIRHLFRVTVGIESMVLGEDEILGQVKNAYETSRLRGFTEFDTHTIFQAAITCSKKIKTETMLSKSSVSVATIAADRCRKFKKEPKKILVIGATGDTGKKIIQNLLSFGDCEILATVRNEHHFTDELEIIAYEDRYQYVDQADVIISATKSPHYTLTYTRLMQQEIQEKPRLFVDLAIPRDIDDGVLRMPDTSLITMDEIEDFAAKNNDLKKTEIEVAEEMVAESLDELEKGLIFHRFLPEFNQMKAKYHKEFAHFVYKYRDMANAREFESFMNILHKMEQEA